MKIVYVNVSKKELADLAVAATGMASLVNGVTGFIDGLRGPTKKVKGG